MLSMAYRTSLFGNQRWLYQAEKLLNCSYSSDYLKSLNTVRVHAIVRTFYSRVWQHFLSFLSKKKLQNYHVSNDACILFSYRSIIFFLPLHNPQSVTRLNFNHFHCRDLKFIHQYFEWKIPNNFSFNKIAKIFIHKNVYT